MSELIKLTGLWINDGKKGKYMSGTLNRVDLERLMALSGDIKLLIFKNDKEDNEKRPDYTLHAAEKERPDYPAQPVANPIPSGPPSTNFEDDIPF